MKTQTFQKRHNQTPENLKLDGMAKSEDIPALAPSRKVSRDYDNPFSDQMAFSPPQGRFIDHVKLPLPMKQSTHAELLGDRERSSSSPPSEIPQRQERKISGEEFRKQILDEKIQSNPNLGSRLVDFQLQSNILKEFRQVSTGAGPDEQVRSVQSAPVTPYETPRGSRQGSPKASRKPGLLGAIFGAGIYFRQRSEGANAGLLSYLLETSEEESLTPIGSPGNVFFEELKTKLDVMDDSLIKGHEQDFYVREDELVFANQDKPSPYGLLEQKRQLKKIFDDDSENIDYRDITILTPTSM